MNNLDSLGNINKDKNCSLQCIFCGRKEEISLIAHRNNDLYITGFVVVCSICRPIKKNLYVKVIDGKK
ncbi:hypothetical protein ES705_42467 [subsurface metagenome]